MLKRLLYRFLHLFKKPIKRFQTVNSSGFSDWIHADDYLIIWFPKDKKFRQIVAFPEVSKVFGKYFR